MGAVPQIAPNLAVGIGVLGKPIIERPETSFSVYLFPTHKFSFAQLGVVVENPAHARPESDESLTHLKSPTFPECSY